MRSTTLALTAALALASVGALAATSNDAIPSTPAAISLGQATTIAEQHVTGKATRAEYEQGRGHGKWRYDVEVVAGDKVFDVKVDATSGSVISSTEDAADRDDEHDEKD
jgi:uncharacterized membrane protein YkoI